MSDNTLTRRTRAAESAISLLEVHEDGIGSGVDQRLCPYLEPGENPVDFRLALRLLARLVQARLTGAIDADQADQTQRAAVVGPRRAVDAAARAVRGQVVYIRRLSSACSGRRRANVNLGIKGPTAEVSQRFALWQQAKLLVERLRQGELLAARRKGGRRTRDKKRRRPFDADALADDLEPAVDALTRACKALAAERRKLAAADDARREAVQRFLADLRDCVGLAAALCQMAGRRDLARQLRAALRQASGKK